MIFCLVRDTTSSIPFQSGNEATIKHLHVVLHKQTGNSYGGFRICTVGLIYYRKNQLCLEKKRKQFCKSSSSYSWAHSADVITSQDANFENLVD